MNKIICWFKGHKRGKTEVSYTGLHYIWHIVCKRCNHVCEYPSPRVRLTGIELTAGFDGH